MSLKEKETTNMPADLIPWKRVNEVHLETAQEYTGFAEVSFAESDQAFAQELSLLIPQGATVVDFGCGPGIQDTELAKLRPDIAKFFLLDLDPQMLEEARKKAEKAQVLENFVFLEADMTKPKDAQIPSESFGFSNTAYHELRTLRDLEKAMYLVSEVIGETGGCMIRDLLRPASARQAKAWRAEVVNDDKLTPREFELFSGSQHAGFSVPEVQKAIDATPLRGRGHLSHLEAPSSRYWVYQVDSKSNFVSQKK